MNKIKLVLVSPMPPPQGGMQTWTVDFLDHFKDSTELDVRLVDQGLIGKRATVSNKKKSIVDELKRTLKIIRALKREIKNGCDVVHVNSPCSRMGIIRDYHCVKAAHKRGLPVVFHCHCNVEKQIKSDKRALDHLRKTVAMADKVLVLNDSSKEYLKEKCGVDSQRVFNFISEDLIAEEKKTNERLERAVFVGNVIRTKGVGEILAAASKFPETEFVIVGKKSDGSFENEAPANVTFIGSVPREEVQTYLDFADMFVFPTYTEGFSVALAEAMARGLPVITTDVGANKDMIGEDGGLIVDVGDFEGLIAATEKMKDPVLRRRMTKFNLERVRDFSVDRIMKEYLKIYEDVYEKAHHADR